MRMRTLFMLTVLLLPAQAFANSYMEMITTAPAGYEAAKDEVEEVRVISALPAWHEAPQPVRAPVVVSPAYKYAVWKQAQRENCCHSYLRDVMQNFIYFLSGAAAARLAYDIWGPHHKHHLLGR